ncbi:protein-glutamate O-methyltransferase family protein [Clostridium beijerinckii]|uniref:protein-glutamate O-methyltransferase family protein n=1 Tax=Clostridium beijerinckii TaxID=1520 RepID=UPI001D3A6188|nr:protein-glutamate O-methyltransferase family protein [Clostridium beijerinckii]NRX09720.1 uncharacterized protein with ATP-grasp and redox domains [Clostridium beijerinckii]NRY01365.1 uncharacterized protein with ATP-grasp and redox domains [Clostridium beijerinckii]NSA90004.1 uncharacterized protein with ATP-grasp and redox domains [Clostridium beijerinckii]
MKMHDKCLPCMVNQVIKVANITGVNNKEVLLKEVFTYLSKMDFEATTPEIIGEIFGMIKNILIIQIHIKKLEITIIHYF